MPTNAKSQIASKPTFFRENVVSSPVPVKGKAKTPGIVDAGGRGDCGFRAVAVGIIDNVVNNPSGNHSLFNELLKRYALKYSLPPLRTGGLFTPQERSLEIIQAFSRPYEMAKFIIRMADILRQIAVDEVVKYPDIYRGAIISDNENTSPEIMRKPETWIDETAIAALANAIELPVIVKVTEPGKELFMREGYGPKKGQNKVDPVVIHLQSKHYQAEVSNTTPFANVSHQEVDFSVLSQEPVDDPDMPELLAKIAKADAQVMDHYEANINRLRTMVECKEIARESLLDIYISAMAESDYLRGRIRYVGLEHGNQTFFEDALKQQAAGQTINVSKDYEMQLTNELVHAIARAVSIGQLDENKVFDRMEQPAMGTRMPGLG